MTTDTPFKQTHAKQTGHAKQTLSPAGFARCGLAAALAAALMLSTAASASAFGYGQDYRDGERITVHELGGVRQVTVPVRWSGNGYEVYVPSWGWTDCAVSCDYTVKKWHFHFWEDQTERGIGSGALGRFLGLD